MLSKCKRNANTAAVVWFVSTAVLIATVIQNDAGNISGRGNPSEIMILLIGGCAYFSAFWWYAKAKGHSGFLGVGLSLLSVIGLVVLALLRDHRAENPA